MANDTYFSTYSGPQVDETISKVLNADTSPTDESDNMVTSNGVYQADQVIVAAAAAAQSTANSALSAAASAQATADAALPKAGGTMAGNINMANNRVTSLPSPVSNNDAANKSYVDDQINASVSGLGNVSNAGSSTDNAIARFDQTSGKLIQNSGVIIDDGNNITGVSGLNISGTFTGKGVKGYRPYAINSTTTDYTLVINDANTGIVFTGVSGILVTIPNDSTTNFDIGTEIEIIRYNGAVTLAADGGVVINSKDNLLELSAQYTAAIIKKIAANEWLLIGDLA